MVKKANPDCKEALYRIEWYKNKGYKINNITEWEDLTPQSRFNWNKKYREKKNK